MHRSKIEFPSSFRAHRWMDAALPPGAGYAAASAYVEALWLPVLGPSATWALRRLASHLAASHDCLVDLDTLARSLGLGSRTGRHSVIATALNRLVQFDIARWDGSALAVRTRLSSVPYGLRRHLPAHLNELHDRMTQDREAPVAAVA